METTKHDLEKIVEEYLDFLKSDNYYEDGISKYENNILQTAVQYVKGSNIWTEINNILEEE